MGTQPRPRFCSIDAYQAVNGEGGNGDAAS